MRKLVSCVLLAAFISPLHLAFGQSLVLDGEYILPSRAAAMSAYTADPDYPHAVLLNPAKLAFAVYGHAASDLETFSRNPGEFFLGDSAANSFSSGRMTAWDVSAAFPAGPVGVGIAYTNFYLGGWQTGVAEGGIGFQLPFGFAAGITGKYIEYKRVNYATPLTSPPQYFDAKTKKITLDIGLENRTVLADNTFFRAVLSEGATFTNLFRSAALNPAAGPYVLANPQVQFPSLFNAGVSYLFASNYRLADFELFRLTGSLDYTHLLDAANPIDDLIAHHDQYRLGIETSALGILSLRFGYVFKSPSIKGEDDYNHLQVSMMGSGLSYGFSMRFPIKLVIPALPITTIEASFASCPEWSSNVYHDVFGLNVEVLL